MNLQSQAIYGQCPKCGGNLANCYKNGCPADAIQTAKKLTPLQIFKARWLIRTIGYERWARKQKLNPNSEYLGDC